ncbi:MAG: DUF58 domain-containing protein [Pseudomonadota bacterium]
MQTGTVICAALGLDTDLTLVYQLFALLLCLLVISRFGVRLRRPAVSVRRRLPRYATAGVPFEYYIEVTNEGDLLENDLTVIDIPKVQTPTIDEFRRNVEPGEQTRNAWDRFIGFHRYMWLQRRSTGLTTLPRQLPDIGVRSRHSQKIEATPLRRGHVEFEATTILHPDPMGLNQGITRFENAEKMLILPRRYQVPASEALPQGRHFQRGGVHAAWSVGESGEFASLREYRDGDSMRRIHWASTAKRAKPVVKEYQEEYLVRQALVLDTTSADPATLEEAVSLCASFIQNTGSDTLIDLHYLAEMPVVVTAGRGETSGNHQLECLATLQRSDLTIDQLTRPLLEQLQRLSGAILVLTDWTDLHQGLVERVRALGLPTLVYLVCTDPGVAEVPAWVRVLDVNDMQGSLNAL